SAQFPTSPVSGVCAVGSSAQVCIWCVHLVSSSPPVDPAKEYGYVITPDNPQANILSELSILTYL
ncbi:hypothetical protein QQF64_028770, partial [Cirrhinus molitorella]